jgi:15-cis-phytoene synthase
MEMDITKKVYLNLDQTEEYIYGSAGVIGLYMSKILNVPEKYYENAKKLGNAFQYINFIRDIDEDLKLGRNYFPQDQLIAFSLPDLQPKTVFNKPQYYIAFIESSIHQYYLWLEEGLEGIRALPKPFSIAVQTASDMYEWTAKKITKNPFIVYEKKMKPNKFNVVLKGIINTLKFNLRK